MEQLISGGKSKAERGWLSKLRQLLNGCELISGSLVSREHTCGKKYCRCMSGSGYRHSSWYLGRSIKGKIYMKYVSHEQIRAVKQWVKRYKQARQLLRKLGDGGWQRIGKSEK